MSKSKYPEQVNPTTAGRRAVAPYNFIQLPEQVIAAEDAGDLCVHKDLDTEPHLHLVRQDSYHAGRHTGQITATLRAVSPLYTRTGLSPEEFAAISGKSFSELSAAEKERYAEFFHLNGVPTLPGSSLRGMLRTLIEIVTQSKLTGVMREKPFFRTLTDPATKDIYYDYFLEDLGSVQHRPNPRANCYRAKVHAGYFRYTPNGAVIEACEWGRIERGNIPRLSSNPPPHELYDGRVPNQTPNWSYQYQTIFVQLDSEADHFFPRALNRFGKERHPDLYLRFRKVSLASKAPAAGYDEAMLVLTGDMQHKHLEFVFLKNTIATYTISDDMVRRFHDDDQISLWQQDAFPEARPRGGRQRAKNDGRLKDGDPVFFLLDSQNKVLFFGRAQNFRLPYPHSPLDFVPPELRNPAITDIAEAMFGYVPKNIKDKDKEDTRQAYAGRVFVDDAALVEEQRGTNVWLDLQGQTYLVPQILGSPKPTTFQHYLVQPPISDEEKQELRDEVKAQARKDRKRPRDLTDEEIERMLLKHYASTPVTETVIRGHKLYWHKGVVAANAIQHPDTSPGNEGTQHTGMRPVKPDTRFALSIRFENLSDVELGALLWLVQLASDNRYALKLGMGKPLGLGSVQLEGLTVTITDRRARYTTLFDAAGDWETGAVVWDAAPQQACVAAFQSYIVQHSGVAGIADFEQLPRIQQVRCMLAWPGPDPTETRYMQLSQFKDRPILPRPDALCDSGQRVQPAQRTAQAEPQAGRAASPVPPTSTTTAPSPTKIGSVFTGTILEVDNRAVVIQIPNVSISTGLAIIEAEYFGTRTYREGKTARVEVIGIEERKGKTILKVKPAPKS